MVQNKFKGGKNSGRAGSHYDHIVPFAQKSSLPEPSRKNIYIFSGWHKNNPNNKALAI